MNQNKSSSENTQASQAAIAHAEKVQPMWKIVFSQFLNHRMAVVGLVVIILFILVALGASIIQKFTGLDPEYQNPLNRYKGMFSETVAPASKREEATSKWILENADLAKSLQEELVAKSLVVTTHPDEALTELANGNYVESTAALAKLEPKEATKSYLKVFKSFSTYHVFGTDELGRDVLIRLVYGTQVSMTIGILVAVASTLIGLLIGSLAGFYGGFIDNALMRVTDALLSLPLIPILIVVAAIDLKKIPFLSEAVGGQYENYVKLVFVLLINSWMGTARLIRGSILSIREREFILAARTLGAKDSTIIVRHMFPNVIAPLLVSVTLGVGESILFEAALSYLGLGIQPPTPSWGNMLFNAQEYIFEMPSLAITPGLLVLIVTISFNYLGDGLQDAIDPKAVRR